MLALRVNRKGKLITHTAAALTKAARQLTQIRQLLHLRLNHRVTSSQAAIHNKTLVLITQAMRHSTNHQYNHKTRCNKPQLRTNKRHSSSLAISLMALKTTFRSDGYLR